MSGRDPVTVRRPWFANKRNGHGITPVAPQGWIVVIAYAALCATAAARFGGPQQTAERVTLVLGLTAAFALTMWSTWGRCPR